MALYELSQNASADEARIFIERLSAQLRDGGKGYQLQGVLNEYRSLLTKKSELPEVVVRSAEKLDDATIRDILAKLKIDQQTTVISHVDKGMIGGVFVKAGNKLFDLSLARRLARLGQRLKKS